MLEPWRRDLAVGSKVVAFREDGRWDVGSVTDVEGGELTIAEAGPPACEDNLDDASTVPNCGLSEDNAPALTGIPRLAMVWTTIWMIA